MLSIGIEIVYIYFHHMTLTGFNVVPSYEETSFQPPYIVCISVIINDTNYNLQFSMDLCVQLSM